MATMLPFSKRTTSSAAVFACIFIASPMQGADQFTTTAALIGALSLEYAQLLVVYQQIITQPTANNRADLYAAIQQAETVVAALNVTVDAVMAETPDNQVILAGMQAVAAHALATLRSVIADE